MSCFLFWATASHGHSPNLDDVLTAELQPGKDANADGRVGWQEGEGGLQQVEEHVKLMLAGEGLGES